MAKTLVSVTLPLGPPRLNRQKLDGLNASISRDVYNFFNMTSMSLNEVNMGDMFYSAVTDH